MNMGGMDQLLLLDVPPGAEDSFYSTGDVMMAMMPLFAACAGLVYSMRAAFRPLSSASSSSSSFSSPSPDALLAHILRRRLALVYILVVSVALYAVALRTMVLYRHVQVLAVLRHVNPLLLWNAFILPAPESEIWGGRFVDFADPQWRGFRENLPKLLLGLATFVAASRVLRTLDGGGRRPPRLRLLFYAATGAAFHAFLFGLGGSARFLTIALANFAIARGLTHVHAARWVPAATWTFCITSLFAADYYSGFFAEPFSWFFPAGAGRMRWDRYFNIMFCRLVSFNCDYAWASMSRPISRASQRSRLHALAETHLEPEHYSLLSYLAYVLYFPLQLAGPISSFNAWMAQVLVRQSTVSFLTTIRILVVTLLEAASLSVFCAYIYVYSLNESITRGVPLYGFDLCVQGVLTVMYMYMKFLVIWRVFRVFSLFDGIDVHDNITSCIMGAYSFADFWRQWHVSMHHWVMRYIYVPLGGSRSRHWSVFVIFTFIGLWHDLMVRWLAWAMFNCTGYILEAICVHIYASPLFLPIRRRTLLALLFEHIFICANTVLLTLSNLAIIQGFDGTMVYLDKMMKMDDGSDSALAPLSWLICAATLLISIRVHRRTVAADEAVDAASMSLR